MAVFELLNHVWIKKWDTVCSFFIFYLYLNILVGLFWTSALLSCYWLQHCTWHISVVLLHMWKESPKTPLWFQRKRNCLKRCHLSQCVSVGAEACLPGIWSPVSMLCCGDDLLATFQLADLSISKKCVSHGGSGILVVVTLVGDPGEVWFWHELFFLFWKLQLCFKNWCQFEKIILLNNKQVSNYTSIHYPRLDHCLAVGRCFLIKALKAITSITRQNLHSNFLWLSF